MGALPKALARRGHRVMVVAPRYQNYEEGWETGVRIQLSVGGSTVEVTAARVCFTTSQCAGWSLRQDAARLMDSAAVVVLQLRLAITIQNI